MEVLNEGGDLVAGVTIVYVAIGLGFANDKFQVAWARSPDDVGTIPADERRDRIARDCRKVRCHSDGWMALLYRLGGANNQVAVRVTLRHLGGGREDARRGR